jgi:hypothetical protein
MMLEGISKRIYGTKKMVSAVLYSVEPGAMPRSSRKPKMVAFAIFVLSVICPSAKVRMRESWSLRASPIQKRQEI